MGWVLNANALNSSVPPAIRYYRNRILPLSLKNSKPPNLALGGLEIIDLENALLCNPGCPGLHIGISFAHLQKLYFSYCCSEFDWC
jgi:hypothetical protein